VKFEAELDGQTVPVEVTDLAPGPGEGARRRVRVGDTAWEVDAREASSGIWSLIIDGASYLADVSEEDGVSVVQVDGETYRIRVEEETRYIIRTRGGHATSGGQVLKAPMPGRVVAVEVAVGQAVQPGQGLVILEAMKMENEFTAAVAGTVKEVRVEPGQTVNPGDVLLVIE
jgi:biotin carboxyl carrier protein